MAIRGGHDAIVCRSRGQTPDLNRHRCSVPPLKLSPRTFHDVQGDQSMSTNHNLDPADRFLRLPQVREITGRSRSRIYDDPTFPKPIKLSIRESAWVESEVRAWMTRRYQQSRHDGAA